MNQKHHSHRLFVFSLLVVFALACNAINNIPGVPSTEPTVTTAPPATVPPTTETEPPQSPDAGSAGMGDSLYPGFGNGGYDVQHYTLDITIHDVTKSDLTAITTIEAKATQDLSSFNLDFIGFEIAGITVNGEDAEFSRDGQELTVTPSSPLSNGEAFTVAVSYNGIPSEMNSEAIPVPTGWIVFDGGIYVLSEPDGSASFYPVNDHPLDKASYTFIVTVPKPFEVAANGLLKEQTDNGDTITYTFEAKERMASYLATINVAEFNEETDTSPNGVPIRNYYQSTLSADVRKPFARQGEMIDYYSGVFGPYPFEVYGALVMDTEFGAALENQTMSIFGIDMIDTEHVDSTELVVAHELTHQWFGDSVSVADWRDIWLNEGFATYGEGLWLEHTQGSDALNDWVKSLYSDVNTYREYMSAPGDPPADNLFNGGVYEWGGLTLHALRLKVGDEAFFEILKTYYARHADGNATTDDFIAVAEEVSGQDLKQFFTDWLYSGVLPPIPEMGLSPQSK